MIGLTTILGLYCLGRLVQVHWERFHQLVEEKKREGFWPWCIKGLMVPVLLLTLFNTGWLFGLPPLFGSLATTTSSGWNSFSKFYQSQCLVIGLVALWWAAFSCAWLLGSLAARSAQRSNLMQAVLLWSLVGLPVAWVATLILGILGLGLALVGWFAFLVHVSFEYLPRRRPAPAYSAAIGKLKMGKLEEAEWAVINQLEEFENDFQGWMLLAEVYAEHYGDLPAAEQTILELCAQENTNLSDISVALHRLADWYLKVGDDPAGARFALEEICRRMPDTHMDKMARQRIERLPLSPEEWEEKKRGRTFALPHVEDLLHDTLAAAGPTLSPEESQALAEDYVARLRRDPNDIQAREELAGVYTEQLGRVDLGLEQLELLMAQPDVPPSQVMKYLQRAAHWQLHYARDREAARQTLRRLIMDFPKSVQAFAAQRHLNLMEHEDRNRWVRPN